VELDLDCFYLTTLLVGAYVDVLFQACYHQDERSLTGIIAIEFAGGSRPAAAPGPLLIK
jgi:hypothetical protein